jgi:hypothetical protein
LSIFLWGIYAVYESIFDKPGSRKSEVSLRRVQAIITDGKRPAKKPGEDYVIREAGLKLVTV